MAMGFGQSKITSGGGSAPGIPDHGSGGQRKLPLNMVSTYYNNHIAGNGPNRVLMGPFETAVARKNPEGEFKYTYGFELLQLEDEGEVLVAVVNTTRTKNLASMNLYLWNVSSFDKHCVRILSNEDRLTEARIRYLMEHVDELVPPRIEEARINALSRKEKAKEEKAKAAKEDPFYSSSDEEEEEEEDRYWNENIKPEEWHVCNNTTLVAIAEQRIFVAGPGRFSVVIAGPAGARVLSEADPEALDIQIFEYEHRLAPNEFLVMLPETLHVSKLDPVAWNEWVQKGYWEVADRLCEMDDASESSVLVLHKEESRATNSNKVINGEEPSTSLSKLQSGTSTPH
ncbi:hypothetical protein SELMODRAFT_403075 [Selaginella moellendorffii]|uniref:Uncharacterized protein n=1 Tax=Selaginella moellendorffii TaxID=88036 RepID=D8QNZ1_SELML|nr:uncharacterized protein LOC9633019 [Selaginella moellendorffii]EFJ38839.1 hypothetical protein SELMODRAFT_403075 [Selaginella moellendorffii]|eukprot:XP_002961300.1 uncharacterized protein LOC9633019 [Selaginella moellendorffii]